jgi:hypothetical protein
MKDYWNERIAHQGAKLLKGVSLAAGLILGFSMSAEAAPEQLATQGNQIVIKSTGVPVRLTGANIPSLEWGNGEHLFESLTEMTSNWNCNIIRLPIKGSSWLNSSSYRNTVDSFMRRLRRWMCMSSWTCITMIMCVRRM